MDNIIFICTNCGLCLDSTIAKAGCTNCSTRLFRVAYRNENPYGGLKYRTTPKNPYRHDTEEDGYNFVTPFNEESALGTGDMSNSALGNGRNSGDVGYYHEPGDSFDRNMSGGSSDNFHPDNSPLRDVNRKEPLHIGPHNMPHFNSLRDQNDLFERVRKRRKHL